MTTYNPERVEIYIGGQRIDAMSARATERDVESPRHGLGSLKPIMFTAILTMTPDDTQKWREFVESIKPPRLFRLEKKRRSRVLRAYRRAIVRLAGFAGVTVDAKRDMVRTGPLLAMGIRIPRSLR